KQSPVALDDLRLEPRLGALAVDAKHDVEVIREDRVRAHVDGEHRGEKAEPLDHHRPCGGRSSCRCDGPRRRGTPAARTARCSGSRAWCRRRPGSSELPSMDTEHGPERPARQENGCPLFGSRTLPLLGSRALSVKKMGVLYLP